MTHRRLFTFGCSFTQYWRWPTWADALGHDRTFFQNWGKCGAGNSYIFNSLIECHRRHSLGPNDDVIIMWTNTSRQDHYVQDQWVCNGNVYWGSDIPWEYVQKFCCERGFLMRDLAFVDAAQQLLDHWGCDWYNLSMVPLSRSNLDSRLGGLDADSTSIKDVCQIYDACLQRIRPSMFETVFDHDWNRGSGLPDHNNPVRRDFHPTPLEHLEYIDTVLPEMPVNDRSRNWMADHQQHMEQGQFRWIENNLPNTRL